MRACRVDEVLMAARCLHGLPLSEQPAQAQLWIAQSHIADKYRKRLKKYHPLWGNGSLLSRLDRTKRYDKVDLGDPDFLQALVVMLSALQAWRANPAHR